MKRWSSQVSSVVVASFGSWLTALVYGTAAAERVVANLSQTTVYKQRITAHLFGFVGIMMVSHLNILFVEVFCLLRSTAIRSIHSAVELKSASCSNYSVPP